MKYLMNSSKYIFYGLVILPFVFVVSEADFSENFLLIFIHIAAGFISIKIILRKDSGMLVQAAGVFFFIFFAIFPIHELTNKIIYWDGDDFSSEIRLLGTSTVFCFILFFWAALKIKFATKNRGLLIIHSLFKINCISNQKNKLFLFYLIIGIFLLLYLYQFQILALFVKGGEFGDGLVVDSKISYLLTEFFLRPLLFNMATIFFLFGSKNIFHKIFFIILMILSASPSGVSRFLVAALYMPIVLVTLMSRCNQGRTVLSENFYLLPNLLLFGTFFLFPLLEIFRDFSFEKLRSFSFFEFQEGGAFDAFQMFLRAMELGSVSYGYGFLGVLLFFIPRSIWPSKPITSGIEISQIANLRLDNVSMPIIGEFYLNFWYLGVMVGAPLLAMFFKRIDWYYLRYKNSNLSLGHLVYFQLAGLVLYNMRGGLLSSFAYTVSILISWLIISFAINSKNKIKD